MTSCIRDSIQIILNIKIEEILIIMHKTENRLCAFPSATLLNFPHLSALKSNDIVQYCLKYLSMKDKTYDK